MGATIITGKAAIQGVRLCTLKAALKLEVLGLRHSRGSVYALVKREFGFRGNKRKVLALLEGYIASFNKAHGFERPKPNECPGHESTDGPAGVSVKCDGTCQKGGAR